MCQLVVRFVLHANAPCPMLTIYLQAIQERIQQLDFHDCKVRISNVDSQGSFNNILIQVIGELSNKGGEPRKFVQTFVLAQQPSGYFVLNDIFRYIDEETEDEPLEAATEMPAQEAPAAPAAPAAEPAKTEEKPEADSTELDTQAVDEKLDTAANEAPAANGDSEDSKALSTDDVPATDADAVAKEVAEEAVQEAEKPKDPSPTPAPAAAVPAQAESAPAEPTGPPKPMTWASRAAAAAGPRPVVPLPKTATPPATQARAPAPAPAAAASTPAAAPASTAAPTQTTAPASKTAAETPVQDASGWQTAGADAKKQGRPQSVTAASSNEKEGTLGYVKFVTDKVKDADLKNALAIHGELTYFDINRQKVSHPCPSLLSPSTNQHRTAPSSSTRQSRVIRLPWLPTPIL